MQMHVLEQSSSKLMTDYTQRPNTNRNHAAVTSEGSLKVDKDISGTEEGRNIDCGNSSPVVLPPVTTLRSSLSR